MIGLNLRAAYEAMPTPLRRAVVAVAGPNGPFFRPYLRLRGHRSSPIPSPTPLPQQAQKVYIAPVNPAEQARQWATAIEAHLPGVGARHMMTPGLKPSILETDQPIQLGAFHLSKTWRQAEFRRASEFTHLLNESLRPMFGPLFRYDAERELSALRANGVSVAFMGHGSEIRSPRINRVRTRWSPYIEGSAESAKFQEVADRNARVLQRLGISSFVSTPDLLEDLPGSSWCPLVVDGERWRNAAQPLGAADKLRVTHIPSHGRLKGTQLITPAVARLHDAGILEYRPLSNVQHSQMPFEIGSADVVLEQFMVGSYGVTAVEAMAAGRVVVGHVLPSVRSHIHQETGFELPIVEATPDDLDEVLEALAGNTALLHEIGRKGVLFAERVHNGELSAKYLAKNWILRS